MPKATLGADAKRQAKELAENEVLTHRLHEITMWKSLTEVADETGLNRSTISAIHQDPKNVGKMKLENVRKVARSIGLSKSEWDRLGGFDKDL